ncbi:MAG TPA: phage terminase large subunit [Stellaceae bacterium]|nr:phage terminase large subunit [Stellaceae bacterium]
MAPPSLFRSAPQTPNFRLTERQQALNELLAGPQLHTLLVGGARSGKTFLFTRAILTRALRAPGSRHAMLRLRGNAARSSLWLDTLPKVGKLCFPEVKLEERRLDGYVSVPGGSEIWVGGLDDKERVEKILGMEYATIYFCECSQIPYSSILIGRTRLAQKIPGLALRAYYDLNPVGTAHWTHREFVEGRDPQSRRPLAEPNEFAYAYINPRDNAENLPPETLKMLAALPERQRKRFWDGVYQAEIDGALWTLEVIEHARCSAEDVPADLARVVVAVDPSGTAGTEDSRSDQVGIVVAARGIDGNAYVLADLTCDLPPEAWGRRVVEAYDRHHADTIVAEQNFGGDMVRAVIQAAAGTRTVPVKLVSASRGKAVRAEPVSALYGHQDHGVWQGDRIRHVGEFAELEDQMLSFSTAGYLGTRSPDRADALVWAITELMVLPSRGLWSREMFAGEA